MKILRIDASARTNRSITRDLADTFIHEVQTLHGKADVIVRDVGRAPPPFIDEEWIAACFTPEAERSPAQQRKLSLSDTLISELSAAQIILIAVPMYNYGMPAALKAWVDQVVRVNKTFSFDLSRGDWPLEPILSGKQLLVVSSRGEFGFEPGGVRAEMNSLDPHIAACARYLGVSDIKTVAVEYQEFGDDRHAASIKSAKAELAAIAQEICPSQLPEIV